MALWFKLFQSTIFGILHNSGSSLTSSLESATMGKDKAQEKRGYKGKMEEDAAEAVQMKVSSEEATHESFGIREVRATFTAKTVRVYQAYNDQIADAAVAAQRFVAPWKPHRMTWIKPSAIWMGYRCGWGGKDKNQARVLAVDLHREAFDSLLREAQLAKRQKGSPDVVVQWDPERALGGQGDKNAFTHPISARSLQMGLRFEATQMYAEKYIAAITDVTSLFHSIGDLLEAGDVASATDLLPKEEMYPLPPDLAILCGGSDA
eukprot:gnl/MRDRNA2_/MRDRNA2_101481_c0_seq1.p1 gnl/MRDRNA2_/MRDRNA2_101481_c0~~gnl/MRDRNA2_/MRDRNA2_101481_c0_seq1.p1  ORF type:complete len:263 (+),score=67.33 gnl/MRDRNA2_/MRDRNA2_101481_c0_seq1:40-828(+)